MITEYKYYKGESECPEEWKKTIRGRFWHGEMMFESTNQSLRSWVTYAQTVILNLEKIDKAKFERVSSYTIEQIAVILYIETLFGKWCPYDDMIWIYEY